jgi:hypothetical protein
MRISMRGSHDPRLLPLKLCGRSTGLWGNTFFVPHDSTLRDGFIRFYPDRIDRGRRRIPAA